MKRFFILLGVCCAISISHAQWTEPVPIEPQPGTACRDPWISNDELRLYGASVDPLWVMTRESLASPWDSLQFLPDHINITNHQRSPCESPNGDTLYWMSQERPEGSYGGYDIYYSIRADTGWGPVFNAGPEINAQYSEYSVGISRNGLILLVASCRMGTIGADIYYHEKQPDGEWGPPIHFGPQVCDINWNEEHPCLSPDNSRLFFYRHGFNLGDIFMSEKVDGVWQTAQPLPYPVNESDVYDRDPCISPNGRELWYLRHHRFEDSRWFITIDTTVTSVFDTYPTVSADVPHLGINYLSNGSLQLFVFSVPFATGAEVTVYNILGRSILREYVFLESFESGLSGRINPTNLPTGLYILSVQINGQVLNTKFFNMH